jgi:hypothetical protein
MRRSVKNSNIAQTTRTSAIEERVHKFVSMLADIADTDNARTREESFCSHISGGRYCVDAGHFPPTLSSVRKGVRPFGRDAENWEIRCVWRGSDPFSDRH